MNRNRIFVALMMFLTGWFGLAWAAESHQGHSMHGNHAAPAQNRETFLAKPFFPAAIQPGKPMDLSIEITAKGGRAVERFDIVHEQVMHLIVVSADLRFFDHIHPEYRGNGRFTVQTVLPAGGTYTYFCDYKPAGQPAQVSVFTAEVPGATVPAPAKSTARSQVQGDTLITLNTEPPSFKAGQETILHFTLQRAADQSPISDLQPYLGELGHLVIIRESGALTAAEYIHTHPLPVADHANAIPFMAVFPQAGWYKLFGQFNRGGGIVISPFWIQVD